MGDSRARDELTVTVLSVVESLPQQRKAALLLEHALALIHSGRYDPGVEALLDVYLRTPELPPDDRARALLARGTARKDAAQLMLMRAELDFRSALSADPSNREAQMQLQHRHLIPPPAAPASQRAPAEVWDRIASHTPRYFLRAWLSVARFHRAIASRHLFAVLDLYVGGEDGDALPRTMDVLERVRADPVFARRVRALRLHWACEAGELLELVLRIVAHALPAFTALESFEWTGYPELPADTVAALRAAHPRLARLGCVGWHFDAVGISAFAGRHLREFAMRAEDDDGLADMCELRALLDGSGLRELTLGAHLGRPHSWDGALASPALGGLTNLALVDTVLTHHALSRVVSGAPQLEDLTLHGTLASPGEARALFDRAGSALFPRLASFRFVVAGHDDDEALYAAVVRAMRDRPALRRLDLGAAPWEHMRVLLPMLTGLRVLRLRIAMLAERDAQQLAASLPREMRALHLDSVFSYAPMDGYATHFARFPALQILHLRAAAQRRPQAAAMSPREFDAQTRAWLGAAARVARALPGADYVGWHGEHFVVLRREGRVEVKELPVRRRLDCGRGVDLGGADAHWVERKDVPIGYEVSGLEA